MMADADGTCSACGGSLTAGRCLQCENQPVSRFVHREILILAVLAAIAVAAFLLTRRFAASNETLRLADARTFFTQGQEALDQGHLDVAVSALQQAAVRNPGDLTYQRALVQALTAAGKTDSARALLLELRDQRPEDPETNLQLARLEAGRGDRTAAGRYYETAIVGLWPQEDRSARRQVRTEFIEFLLNRGERDRALSELLVLEAGLPDDAPSQLSAGHMLLEGGDPRRALDHFERVLRKDAKDATALAGAGEAAYRLGDYTRASRYFNALKEADDRIKELHILTDLVLSRDPLAPRLASGERRRRLIMAVEQSTRRLEACQGTARTQFPVALEAVLADLRALDATLAEQVGPSPSDQIEDGLDLTARAERLADSACGPPEVADKALVLIARRHGFDEE